MYSVDSGLMPHYFHAAFVVEHTSVSILIVDGEGRVQFINPAGEKLLSCSREEAVGTHVGEWIPELPLPPEVGFAECRKEVRRRDGTSFPAWLAIDAYMDEGGLVHYFLIVRPSPEEREEERVNSRPVSFECLFDHNPLAVCLLDDRGRFTRVNAVWESMTGYQADELTGTHLLELVPAEDRSRAEDCFARTLSGEAHLCEVAILRKDGRPAHLKMTSIPIVENGSLVGVCGMAEDITEQKQMGEDLRQAQQELQNLVRQQQGMIFTFRKEQGRYIHRLCDGELLSRLRLTPDDVVGKDLYELLPEADADRLLPYYERAWQGESVTYEGETPYGVSYFTALKPILRDGQVVEVVGSTVDISEKKRKEEELRQTKELLESLINNTIDAIDVVDADGNVVHVNKAFETTFGWRKEELVGKPLPIIPPHLMDEHEWIKRTVFDGGHISGLETVRQRKDGSLINVSVSVSVVRDRNGNIVAAAAICRDITERKRTEELLRHSEKLSVLGQMAAGIAHEIRNPLTALKGFIQLLQSNAQGDQGYYQIMLSELERINFIVSELLVLAKPQPVQFQLRDLTQMLKNVVTLLETQAIINNVQIASTFDPDVPLITCEENHLKQVFINILKNAIEAMPDGGTIELTTERVAGDHVRVRVTDQGPGIPQERLTRMGEPFYTTKEKGTGLGLMISHRIIEAHRGSLVIRSEIGKGTTVDILLPVNVQADGEPSL